MYTVQKFWPKEPNLVPEPQVWTTLVYCMYCSTSMYISIHVVYYGFKNGYIAMYSSSTHNTVV